MQDNDVMNIEKANTKAPVPTMMLVRILSKDGEDIGAIVSSVDFIILLNSSLRIQQVSPRSLAPLAYHININSLFRCGTTEDDCSDLSL